MVKGLLFLLTGNSIGNITCSCKRTPKKSMNIVKDDKTRKVATIGMSNTRDKWNNFAEKLQCGVQFK